MKHFDELLVKSRSGWGDKDVLIVSETELVVSAFPEQAVAVHLESEVEETAEAKTC